MTPVSMPFFYCSPIKPRTVCLNVDQLKHGIVVAPQSGPSVHLHCKRTLSDLMECLWFVLLDHPGCFWKIEILYSTDLICSCYHINLKFSSSCFFFFKLFTCDSTFNIVNDVIMNVEHLRRLGGQQFNHQIWLKL